MVTYQNLQRSELAHFVVLWLWCSISCWRMCSNMSLLSGTFPPPFQHLSPLRYSSIRITVNSNTLNKLWLLLVNSSCLWKWRISEHDCVVPKNIHICCKVSALFLPTYTFFSHSQFSCTRLGIPDFQDLLGKRKLVQIICRFKNRE